MPGWGQGKNLLVGNIFVNRDIGKSGHRGSRAFLRKGRRGREGVPDKFALIRGQTKAPRYNRVPSRTLGIENKKAK
jgi:hypothetical protein